MKPKLPSLEGFIQDVKKIYDKDLERVILFGSYARNEQTADSDIDIFVIVDRRDIIRWHKRESNGRF